MCVPGGAKYPPTPSESADTPPAILLTRIPTLPGRTRAKLLMNTTSNAIATGTIHASLPKRIRPSPNGYLIRRVGAVPSSVAET